MRELLGERKKIVGKALKSMSSSARALFWLADTSTFTVISSGLLGQSMILVIIIDMQH